ncbi:MAG: hypothetical protein FWD80_00160 [Propionibacteriaceae bacterium]|nr:hypothetical protein [Propionibacteriaceae bacterium]
MKLEDNWTAEQVLNARVAEAKCSDDMSYTQQVMDIVAAYQEQVITKHEAELVAMKQQLDERVTRATQLLVDIGVM